MRDLFDILKLTIEDFNVIDNRNVSLCYPILYCGVEFHDGKCVLDGCS